MGHPPSIDTACRALLLPGGLRVWSLVVTIFGDLARDPQDRIDGTVLMQLTAGMDVKPEAVRVALHRLRNDDWISSLKQGRRASHALTPKGRRESEAVSPLIYTASAELSQDWQVAIAETNAAKTREAMKANGFVQIAPRVFVGAQTAIAPNGAMLLKGGSAPDWLRDQIVPPDLSAAFDALHAALATVRDTIDAVPDMTTLETAILRCLIVHEWRRLVLRLPHLPPAILGTSWPGYLCRDEVTDLLVRLPRPALDALSTG